MHDFVSINGQITSLAQGGISSASVAALYGKGVFTTIAIRKGLPVHWEKHWRRLAENARSLSIDLTEHTRETTRAALVELIDQNHVVDGRARATFYDEGPSPIWPSGFESKTGLHLITGERPTAPESFRIALSPFAVNSRSPLAGIKSCNYLENILAMAEAKGRGFHEAIRLNEGGHITNGCMSNVFWLKQNRLFTPNLSTGCLPGTTREFVLENIECEEVEAGIDELNSADAIFSTSAGIGIVEATEYGLIRFKRSDHQILSLLSDLH